jgi:hypothetical protein
MADAPRHYVDRNRGLRDIYAQFEQLTVDLGAPHSGLSILILRIKSRTSLPIRGPPHAWSARVFNFAQTPRATPPNLPGRLKRAPISQTASVLVISKNSLGNNHMTKLLRKRVFGLPSQEVMGRIDASARAARIREEGYRFEAQLRKLERQFDAKARELSEEYVSTVDELNGEE